MAERTTGADAHLDGDRATAWTLALLIGSLCALAAVVAEVLRQPNRTYITAVVSFDLTVAATAAALVAVALAGSRRRGVHVVAALVGAALCLVALASRAANGQTIPAVRAVVITEAAAAAALGFAAIPGVRARGAGIVPLVLRAVGAVGVGIAVVASIADLAAAPIVRDAREREQVALLVVAVVALVVGATGARTPVLLAGATSLALRLAGPTVAGEVAWLVPLVLALVLAVVPEDRLAAVGAGAQRTVGRAGRSLARVGPAIAGLARRVGTATWRARGSAAAAPPCVPLAALGRADRRRLGLLAVATVVGVAATVVRARAVGWYPIGDDAIIATRAADVGTSNTPLVGLPTSLGPLGPEGLEVHHPGPLLLWITSPFVHLLGPSLGVMVAAAVVFSTALGAAVWGALRARGMAAALITYGLLLVVALTSGSGVPFEPLNAYVPILPLAAVLVLAWSASCGVRSALPWAVLLASVCVQAYVPLAPTALVAVGFAASTTAIPRWRAAGASRTRRTMVTSLAVGLVAWAGPILEAAGDGGGNLRELLTLEQGSGATVGAAGAARALLWLVGVPPGWLAPVPFRAEDASTYLSGGMLGGGLVLVAAVVVVALRWRVWDQGLRRIVVLAGLALVAGASTLMRLPTEFVFVYQVGWVGAVGAFALLATSLVAIDEAHRIPSWSAVRPVARAALHLGVAALLVVLAWPRTLDHYASVAAGSQEAARALADELGDGPGPGRPIAVLADGRSWEQVIANGVAMSLEDRGRSIRVTPLLGGHWGTFRIAGQAPGDPVLIISDGYSPAGPGTGARIVRHEPSGWSQRAADDTAAAVAAWARSNGPVVPRPGLDGLLRSIVQGWDPEVGCERLEDLKVGAATLDDLPDGAIAQLYLEGVVGSPALPDRLVDRLEDDLLSTPTEVWLADAADARASLDGPLAGPCP